MAFPGGPSSPSRSPRASRRNPTTLSLKYGDYGAPPPEYDFRSGLTPIDTLFPADPKNLSREEKLVQAQNKEIAEFQQEKFSGFTTRELVDLDVWTTRKLKAGDLQNPIISLLERQNWETGPYPEVHRSQLPSLRNSTGEVGDWTAANDKIWEALKPAVQIASRVLDSIHLVPWFDAFLEREVREVSQDRVPQQFQQDDVYTFHSRQFSPEDAREKFEEIKVRRDEVFEELIRKYGLKLGFYDERTQPFDDEPLASSHATSYCKTDATDINKHHIFVLLNTNLIEPLLLFDSELTDCERMGHHFFTALTLVHELMQAIQFTSVEDDREYGIREWHNDWEPYFEDEQFCEVGFSMEKAVFGGHMSSMPSTTQRQGQRPHFGHWLKLDWPNLGELNLRIPGSPVLSLDTLPAFSVKIPVEATVYEKAQQTACWSLLVAKYGLKALQGQFPRQGVYYEYHIIPTADDNVDKFGISRNGPDRTMVSSVGISIDKTSSAIVFDDLLVMNVREKQAYKTGQRILASSKNSELDFWESSKDLATNIENFDVFVDGQVVTASDALSVTRYLTPSVKAHLEMIEALLTSEDIFDIVYVERRDNILRWNTGMRRFMASLINSFPGENTLISRVERELPNLDHGRMILAEPNNTPKGLGVQYEEFQAMVDAQNCLERGDSLQCYEQCSKLNNYYSSLVVHACTDIILAQLRTMLDLQARLDALTNGQQILRYLRNGRLTSCWKPGWANMLDQWLDVCTREGQLTDAELHEQGQRQAS